MKDNLNKEIKNNREYKKGKITIFQFLEIAVNQYYHNKWKIVSLIVGTILLAIILLTIRNLNIDILNNPILMIVNKTFNINLPSNMIFIILTILIYIVFVIGLGIPINSKKICEKIYSKLCKRNSNIYSKLYQS